MTGKGRSSFLKKRSKKLLSIHIAAVGVIGLLAACASAPTVFYTLDPYPPATITLGYSGPPIGVDAVRLPADLDRPELIRATGPYVMKVDDFGRWAAPLGELAQRVLTQDLAARLPAGSVIFPGAPRPEAAAAGLTVDMLDFTVAQDQGTMDVSWALDDTDTKATPSGRTLHLTTAIDSTGSKATAEALSRLLAMVADDVAGNLRK